MKKNFLLILSLLMLFLSGCSKVADEKQILSDLKQYENNDLTDEGEKIEKVIIDKRQTEKDSRIDTIWCTVETQNDLVKYQKNVIIHYGLYNKDGWLIDNVEVNDSDQWKKEPLRGVTEDTIIKSLDNQLITVDDSDWKIKSTEFKKISIDKQNTDLEAKIDTVNVSFTLSSTVVRVPVKLQLNYIFKDKWELDSLTQLEEFHKEEKKEVALNTNDQFLIEELSKHTFTVGIPTEGFAVYSVSDKQEITLSVEEISEFKIIEQRNTDKGRLRTFKCSALVTKPNVTFEIEAFMDYNYIKEEKKWIPSVSIDSYNTKSIDIIGTWTGQYNGAPFDGECTLDVLNIDENGLITATYSYIPESRDSNDPGSYQVSGIIDFETFSGNLKAGEWINEPNKYGPFTKVDVSIHLDINSNILKGSGHESSGFELEKKIEENEANSVDIKNNTTESSSAESQSTIQTPQEDFVAPTSAYNVKVDPANPLNGDPNYTVDYSGTEDASGYLFPESSEHKFQGFSSEYEAWVYQYGVNEIYAKHGYSFQTPQVIELFSSKSWYVPDSEFNESVFSEIEKYNIDFLSKCMSATGQDGGYGIPSGNHISEEAVESNTVDNNIQTETHYENQYFTVDVPAGWSNAWMLRETDNSLNGIISTKYEFSFGESSESTPAAGGAIVYVIDMSDHSRPLSHYSRMIPENVTSLGTASGENEVFMTEAGAGFFTRDQGATITLK